MNYCPLMSFQRQSSSGYVQCMRRECGFADEAGDCLIKQALQCYVAKERTTIALEDIYYKVHKDGTLDPITFKQHANKTIEVDCFWERKE